MERASARSFPLENLAAIAADIRNKLNEASAAEDKSGYRWHLGASEIGDECLRRVWLKYRWIKKETVDGRMARLFARGHAEEDRIYAQLERIKINVVRTDPATGRQFLFSSIRNHYGGSSDGIAYAAWLFNNEPFLIECKTHNSKSFRNLELHGMIKSKPKHHIQMCVYGKNSNLQYGLYFAVNKDNDDIYIEIVKLDRDLAETVERKAEAIIYANTAPPKIARKETFFVCKQCTFSGICFRQEVPERNCRSCKYSEPIENGQWKCNHWKGEIPKSFVPLGCDQWRRIV